MTLYEKIRFIRKSLLKLSLKEFHKKLQDIFGQEALTYHSLCRLEKGYRDSIRLKSLYQICTGLGIPLKELTAGTDKEGSRIVNIIRRKDRPDNEYIYNDKAVAEVLSSRDLKFLAMELFLQAGGATEKEQDPLDEASHEKLVIMLQGSVIAHIGNEEHLIKKGDSLSFQSNIPHHFKNPSQNSKARCIIVQNPKSY